MKRYFIETPIQVLGVMKMIDYFESEEYKKSFNKLLKRYRTLDRDIAYFKQFVLEPYFDKGIDTSAFVKIEGGCNEKYDSYKVIKFACMSLKSKGNRSGIRIVFVVDKSIINTTNIEFLEIYFKGDKEMNNMELLKNRINE